VTFVGDRAGLTRTAGVTGTADAAVASFSVWIHDPLVIELRARRSAARPIGTIAASSGPQ
jgi:hypothetical protein